MGARVIAAASSEEKVALAKAHGADDGVVFPPGSRQGRREGAADRFKAACGRAGANVIYDPVGGDYAEAALRAIAWEGRFLVVGFPAGIPKIPLNLPLLKSCQIVGVFWGAFAERDRQRTRQHRANSSISTPAAPSGRPSPSACRSPAPAQAIAALGAPEGDGQDRRSIRTATAMSRRPFPGSVPTRRACAGTRPSCRRRCRRCSTMRSPRSDPSRRSNTATGASAMTRSRRRVDAPAAALLAAGLRPGTGARALPSEHALPPVRVLRRRKAGVRLVHLSPLDAERELTHKLDGQRRARARHHESRRPAADGAEAARCGPRRPADRRRGRGWGASPAPPMPIPERAGVDDLRTLHADGARAAGRVARGHAGRHRAPAIYRRHHRAAEGRDPDPRQPHRRSRACYEAWFDGAVERRARRATGSSAPCRCSTSTRSPRSCCARSRTATRSCCAALRRRDRSCATSR